MAHNPIADSSTTLASVSGASSQSSAMAVKTDSLRLRSQTTALEMLLLLLELIQQQLQTIISISKQDITEILSPVLQSHNQLLV